jgi:hypothetical protein
VFEKYYKQHLAKRLLSGRTVSDGECLGQRRTGPWHAHHVLRCCALLLQQGRVTALQRSVHLLIARFIMLLVSAAPSSNRFACDASRLVPAASFQHLSAAPASPHQARLLLAHKLSRLRICSPVDAERNMLVKLKTAVSTVAVQLHYSHCDRLRPLPSQKICACLQMLSATCW